MGMGCGYHVGVQSKDIVHCVEESAGILWGASARLLHGLIDELHQVTDRCAGEEEEWCCRLCEELSRWQPI